MRKRVQDGIHSINGTGVGILGKLRSRGTAEVTCKVSYPILATSKNGNDFIFVIKAFYSKVYLVFYSKVYLVLIILSLETSHRSTQYTNINKETTEKLRQLL